MATLDDLGPMTAVLRNVAATLYEYVRQKETDWAIAILDLRYAADEKSWVDKIRVTRATGEVVGLPMVNELTMLLIELATTRLAGADRWYGLKLEVTAAGGCKTKFNYDPACSDDPAFFAS